jgi:hypothetical protein
MLEYVKIEKVIVRRLQKMGEFDYAVFAKFDWNFRSHIEA